MGIDATLRGDKSTAHAAPAEPKPSREELRARRLAYLAGIDGRTAALAALFRISCDYGEQADVAGACLDAMIAEEEKGDAVDANDLEVHIVPMTPGRA